jgi:hypothetical protein
LIEINNLPHITILITSAFSYKVPLLTGSAAPAIPAVLLHHKIHRGCSMQRGNYVFNIFRADNVKHGVVGVT